MMENDKNFCHSLSFYVASLLILTEFSHEMQNVKSVM